MLKKLLSPVVRMCFSVAMLLFGFITIVVAGEKFNNQSVAEVGWYLVVIGLITLLLSTK